MYDISVIIINYNSSQYTLECVATILDKTSENTSFNIIVIDNCSSIADYLKIKHLNQIDNITVVRSKLNLGFAGGHMFGLQFTQAKYYFLLNNDCQFMNDCLTELYVFCETHKNVGLCSPQMYSLEGLPIPSFDYFPIISSKILGTGIFRLIKGKDFHLRKKIYSEPIKVDVISGSHMFVRASSFNQLGGLDTNFFLYCEEEDLSMRMYNAGFETWVVPFAKNIHIGSASTHRNIAIRKEFYISFFYFYRKHFGLLRTEILRLILLIRNFKKIFFKWENFKIFIFIICGANLTNSLRHKQELVELDNDNDFE